MQYDHEHKWRLEPELVAYEGEIVLECEGCGEVFYNAQEWFSEEEIQVIMDQSK